MNDRVIPNLDTRIFLTLYLNQTDNSTYLEEISRDEFYEDYDKGLNESDFGMSIEIGDVEEGNLNK